MNYNGNVGWSAPTPVLEEADLARLFHVLRPSPVDSSSMANESQFPHDTTGTEDSSTFEEFLEDIVETRQIDDEASQVAEETSSSMSLKSQLEGCWSKGLETHAKTTMSHPLPSADQTYPTPNSTQETAPSTAIAQTGNLQHGRNHLFMHQMQTLEEALAQDPTHGDPPLSTIEHLAQSMSLKVATVHEWFRDERATKNGFPPLPSADDQGWPKTPDDLFLYTFRSLTQTFLRTPTPSEDQVLIIGERLNLMPCDLSSWFSRRLSRLHMPSIEPVMLTPEMTREITLPNVGSNSHQSELAESSKPRKTYAQESSSQSCSREMHGGTQVSEKTQHSSTGKKRKIDDLALATTSVYCGNRKLRKGAKPASNSNTSEAAYPCLSCEADFMDDKKWLDHQVRVHFPRWGFGCARLKDGTPCKRPILTKRPDAGRNHLKTVHGYEDGDSLERACRKCEFDTTHLYHDTCGFCKESLRSEEICIDNQDKSQQERSIHHILEHMKRGSRLADWTGGCLSDHELQLPEDRSDVTNVPDDDDNDNDDDEEKPEDANDGANDNENGGAGGSQNHFHDSHHEHDNEDQSPYSGSRHGPQGSVGHNTCINGVIPVYAKESNPSQGGVHLVVLTIYLGMILSSLHEDTSNAFPLQKLPEDEWITSQCALQEFTIQEAQLPFKSTRMLGRGGFGFVDEVRLTSQLIPGDTRGFYARKTITRNQSPPKVALQEARFKNELKILESLQHPHLIQLVGSYASSDRFCIIMYPVAEINLAQLLRHLEPRSLVSPSMTTFSLTRMRYSFGCLASALDYLHCRQIRHKDIKPANILIDHGNVILTDFGISVRYSRNGLAPLTASAVTPMYCAPEVIQSGKQDYKADVFSLGCVFLEMLTVLTRRSIHDFEAFRSSDPNDRLFHSKLQQVEQWTDILQTNHEDGRVASLDPPLPFDKVRGMLSKDPDERPTAAELQLQLPPNACCTRSNHQPDLDAPASRQKQGSRSMVRPMPVDTRKNYIRRPSHGLVQPPVESSRPESIDESQLTSLSHERTHPSAGVPDDVSNHTTTSLSELVSRRGLSFYTPTTITNSNDREHFYFYGETGPSGQRSPDAERELQGINSTNRDRSQADATKRLRTALLDTGSNANLITERVLVELGLVVDRSSSDSRKFSLADGRVIRSLGTVTSMWAFAREPDCQSICTFHVFEKLADGVSIVMGKQFLEATQSLTRYRERLKEKIEEETRPHRVLHLDQPKQRLRCCIKSEPVKAHVDTGSQIDAMSRPYALARRFQLDAPDDNRRVQLADGTYANIDSQVSMELKFMFSGSSQEHKANFYVLDKLTSDVSPVIGVGIFSVDAGYIEFG